MSFYKTIILLIAVSLYSCAGQRIQIYVKENYDQSTDRKINIMQNNFLTGGEKEDTVVQLNVQQIAYADSAEYMLLLYCVSDIKQGLLNIREQESLIITADNKQVTLSPYNPTRDIQRITNKKILIEVAPYEISANLLLHISKASKVKVNVIGKERVLERHFTEPNINAFKSFFENYVKDISK